MRKAFSGVKKSVVLLVGGFLVILGIILIPLPGPGVLVTLAGFFVLSTEFEWAHKPLEKARSEMKKIYQAADERAKKVEQWGEPKTKPSELDG